MGFEKSIHTKILLEWKDHYISYKTLKLFFQPFKTTAKLVLMYLKIHKHQKNDESLAISPEEKAQLQHFYRRFREIFSSEIEKINEFLDLQVKICEAEWSLLKSRVSMIKQTSFPENKAESLRVQLIFHQFYLKLGYITEYYKTNDSIKSHIQVKFNILLLIFQDFLQFSQLKTSINPLTHSPRRPFQNLSRKPLRTLHRLLDKSRSLYLSLYYNGFKRNDGEKKLKELFRQTQSKIIPPFTMYALYLFSGIAFILTVMIILLIYNKELDPDSDKLTQQLFKYQFPIFRGFLMIILYLILLSFNVYGWLRCHLNYRAVFGFEKHYSSTSQILSRMMVFSTLWLLTFFIFLVHMSYYGADSKIFNSIPIYYLGGINWALFIAYLFFPHSKYFNGEGRAYFFKIIWKVISKSCWKVEFPMIFVLNQFTSFVLALKDLEYTACFYISLWMHPEKKYPKICMDDTFQIGFLVSFLPLLLRIMQCIRIAYDRKQSQQQKIDIVNVFKFTTSGIVTILSLVVGKLKSANSALTDPIFNLWIAMAIISTIYSYSWDIKMGWALCQKGYGLLRKEMHFSKKIYYSAIVLNFLFRISWILNLSPDIINTIFWRPELSAFVLGFMEMIRRFIWNFIRVDREAVFNKQSFGFIQDIVSTLNELSPESSTDSQPRKTNKLTGKVSLDSHSSFSMEDLLKRENRSSYEDFMNLKPCQKKNMKSEDEIMMDYGEEWELIEEKRKDVKIGREEVEDMKRACLLFEKQIKEKSRNNTFIGIENYKKI